MKALEKAISGAFRNAFFPPADEHDRAGYGPLSDGVPKGVGLRGASEREMPPPPRSSRSYEDNIGTDQTMRCRRKV